MSQAFVIGLGKSGIAAAKLLQQQGWRVQICDRNTSPSLQQQLQELATENISVLLNHTPNLDNPANLPDLIVVSPGVPWDIPLLTQARNLGIKTLGEMELAWQQLQSTPWVGITGTNGKTTTTALTAAIFQSAGLQAPACGNIGYAACELALEQQTSSKSLNWVIAELSSYQIESSQTITPKIGIWTTFTPDHLERHKTLENYAQIKSKLLQASQLQILNGDDPYLHNLGVTSGVAREKNIYWTSIKGKHNLLGDPDQGCYLENGWVYAQNTRIVQAKALRMSGEHNQQNLLMAVLAAKLVGIDPEAIAQGVANFPGVPHRLEHITTWQGIDFVNDSKATNYDAAIVGLASVAAPAILIAGGEAKQGDASAWLQLITSKIGNVLAFGEYLEVKETTSKVATVLLIGKAAPEFAQKLEQVNYTSYEIVETMEQAVHRAAIIAPQQQAKVVLLSPACASFDQYPNFEARGDDFRQLCLAMNN